MAIYCVLQHNRQSSTGSQQSQKQNLVKYLIIHTQNVRPWKIRHCSAHFLVQADALSLRNQNFSLILKKKINQATVCFVTRGRNISQQERKKCIIKDRRVYCNYCLPRLTKKKKKDSAQNGVEEERFLSLKKKALNFETKTRCTLGKNLLIPILLWFCCGLVLYT